jgi:hypothetical protein
MTTLVILKSATLTYPCQTLPTLKLLWLAGFPLEIEFLPKELSRLNFVILFVLAC